MEETSIKESLVTKLKVSLHRRSFWSLILTVLIVTLLIYPTPVIAIQVSISGLKAQSVTQGQTFTFYVDTLIESSERVPISKVRVKFEGPTSFTYEFSTSGGSATYLILAAYQSIVGGQPYSFGYGYGYGSYYGYGYGYFPSTGYGYGFYPTGYGYGYYGSQTLRWQATLTNTASLTVGEYFATVEVESDGVWWGGAPTKVNFYIVAAVPPPTLLPDLTTEFVDLPQSFQMNREYDIKVLVKNMDLRDAGEFNVTLTANSTLLGRTLVSSLGAGANTTLAFKWKPLAKGSYSLKATADSENSVIETDETNNAVTSTVSVGLFVPTPAEVETMSAQEAAQVLEELTANQTADILGQVSVGKCAMVLLAMNATKAASVLLGMNATFAASIMDKMVETDATGAAVVIEKAVAINIDGTVAILEKMNIQRLAQLLIAITRLPSSPQTAAALLDTMSLDKSVEVVKVIVEMEALEDLGKMYTYLSTERMNAITEALTIEQRSMLLSYLTTETIDRIMPELINYPDMTPISIQVTPIEPKVDDASTVAVTIKNIGRADVDTFNVRLVVNSITIQTLSVDGLVVNQTKIVNFSWTPTAQGTYSLTALVDPENSIIELNETNNAISKSVIVFPKALPDLTVAFTNLPTSFQEGTEYQISVTVSNIGAAAAGQFSVESRANDGLVGTNTVSSLATGVSATVTFTWRPTAGQYTLRTVADSENAVVELDETNNTAITSVTVTAISWYVQWWPVIVGAVIILVIIIAIILIRRRK